MISILKSVCRNFSQAVTAPGQFARGDLAELAEKLSSGCFSKISFINGAGISMSANIPDLRSPSLSKHLESLELPFPAALFDINYFKLDPEPFFKVFSLLRPEDAKPTVAHLFIRLLEQKGLLSMCYTQNIDGLEQKAGISPSKLVAAHGTGNSSHCTSCGSQFDQQKMEESLRKNTPAYCECGGLAKPDVVFYGEKLPWDFHAKSELISYSDLVFVVGTSLAVFPFSNLVKMANDDTPRVVINQHVHSAYDHSGFEFGKPSRDLIFLRDIDQVFSELADLLGWGKELQTLKDDSWKI